MADFRPFTSASTALSSAWAKPVTIDTIQNLGGEERRNLILRARVAADKMDPRSIIIKATRAASCDPHASDAYAMSGFAKEWTAAGYLVLPRYARVQRGIME